MASGGFTYWPGSPANFYNDWASNYAGHFLVQADKLGYPVPPQMLNDWIAHQKNLAQAWKPEGGAGLALALACDLRYAAQDAALSVPFTALGMHPGMATTYLLPEVAGLPVARD